MKAKDAEIKADKELKDKLGARNVRAPATGDMEAPMMMESEEAKEEKQADAPRRGMFGNYNLASVYPRVTLTRDTEVEAVIKIFKALTKNLVIN